MDGQTKICGKCESRVVRESKATSEECPSERDEKRRQRSMAQVDEGKLGMDGKIHSDLVAVSDWRYVQIIQANQRVYRK